MEVKHLAGAFGSDRESETSHVSVFTALDLTMETKRIVY